MEFEIEDGEDGIINCSAEEYKKQLIEWWNSDGLYFPQHQGYT